jgi:FdrA protein
MSVTISEIRRGAYYDSIVLMQLQRGLSGLPGVQDAGVVMATPANLELLAASNLLPSNARAAGPDDLLIVVRAESEAAGREALAQVNTLLQRRRPASDTAYRPRSLETALRTLPEARWALVSTPGRYAARVARQALDLGLNVFLYSDNVSLDDEVALKRQARERELMVMGPDCGTAIVNGIGLGFANRVRRGPIGLVGASGTGLQAVTAHIHALGGGISHALGTGGRDLKSEVGASTALQSLDLLARDTATQVIVLVSKPPSPDVAARLLQAARATGKPVVVNFLGYAPPARRLGNLTFALNLADAATLAVESLEIRDWRLEEQIPQSLISNLQAARFVRGLFSGGTLAYEALLGLQTVLHPIYSNVPIHPSQRLADSLHSEAHTLLDLGEDEFTVGRLHPMLDNDLRWRRLRQEAADPDVALILLDVVLGKGAHADPASELAPAIAEAKAQRDLEVVAIVIGTDEDPQNLSAQVERLTQAGATVFRSVTEAVAYVIHHVEQNPVFYEKAGFSPAPAVSLDAIHMPLTAINIGLESFYDSLVSQGAAAVHVDWRPPASGNERLAAMLRQLNDL